MTARELIELAGSRPWILLLAFALPPLLTLVLRFLHGRGEGSESPWKFVYSVLVYVVCIPGILAAILTGYVLFFTRENLLDANILVYGLPILSMVLTLVIMSRAVAFAQIPGFDNLAGLMLVLALTFVILLAVAKTRIWLFFGGSIFTLLLLAVALFVALKWAAHKAFGRRAEPLD